LVLGMQHIRIFVPEHFSLFNYRFMRWFRWQAPLEPLLYGIFVDSGVAVLPPMDDLLGRHRSYISMRFLWTGV
jgi:hypothetical protein